MNYETITEEHLRRIILRAGEHLSKEVLNELRGTKAIKLEVLQTTDKEYEKLKEFPKATKNKFSSPVQEIEVTTWSSLIRNAIDILRPQITDTSRLLDTDEFKATFEQCFNRICTSEDIRLNVNCPRRLFKEAEETDLITSSVYLNNKNHLIKIMDDEDGIDWYICAVYTGEIIVMLETLLDTIHTMIEDYRPEYAETFKYYTFRLTYVNREELEDNNVSKNENDLFCNINKTALEEDLCMLQLKAFSLYRDIDKLAQKYGLNISTDNLFDNIYNTIYNR